MRMKDGKVLELLLIRHAASIANIKGKLAGRVEPNRLSPEGVKQAEQLSSLIEEFKPTRSISSPLIRCQQTLKHAGVKGFETSEEIIEMDYGRWSDKSLKRLALLPGWKKVQRDPLAFRFPGGESFEECRSRLASFRAGFRFWQGERIVLCSHGDIIRILINDLLGRDFAHFQQLHIFPASFSRLQIEFPRGKEQGVARFLYLNRIAAPAPVATAKGYQVGGD
ncbi:MAG: histidine phosphatase family protein [Actinomycetota bacterium]